MNLALPLYRALATGVLLGGLPAFWAYSRLTGRHRHELRERLGAYDPAPASRWHTRHPRIWFHAASVGEVNAAVAIIEALRKQRPDARLFVSTTTGYGRDAARERLGAAADGFLLAPLDWPGAVNRALDGVQPDLLAFVETEIWPVWLDAARRRGVRTALVNGRISPRSLRRYRKVRFLMEPVLKGIDALSMISADDADRIRQLGALDGRIVINGNAKFDLAGQSPDPGTPEMLRRSFRLDNRAPVFVAGSIRGGEDALVLDAFQRVHQRFGDAVLMLAPRHLQRVEKICAEVCNRGLTCQRRSRIQAPDRPRHAPVVVLDTIGELRALYSIATVVFCGGSLVPRGGQNLIEAAAWGKPVICGPHMDDFRAATDLLEAAGAVFPVADGDGLARCLETLLADPETAVRAGMAGKAVVEANRGAADRHAAVLCTLLADGRLDTATA